MATDTCAVNTPLKTTALHAWHAANGGKMVPFAGWEMPLQYQRVAQEHTAVRTAAGLFDVSHMGIVVFEGEPSTVSTWLDTMVPQDIAVLEPSQAVYTQLLNHTGGILDDLILYRRPKSDSEANNLHHTLTEYFIVCNASNTPENLAWFNQHAPNDIKGSVVQTHSLLALQGPKFTQVLEAIGIPAAELPQRFTFGLHIVVLNGEDIALGLSRTGYTGEDGVEIMVDSAHAVTLWEGLLATDIGCQPIGLAARDTLRLEAAYPLHGQELSPEISPLESGLGWSLRLDKPAEFMGKAALLAQKPNIPRQFVCLTLDGKGIARTGAPICHPETGDTIGEVTSGTLLPQWADNNGGQSIAMGLIQTQHCPGFGEGVTIDIRGRKVEATRVKRPFYKGV